MKTLMKGATRWQADTPSRLFAHFATCLFTAPPRCRPATAMATTTRATHQLRLQLINVSHYIKFYLALSQSVCSPTAITITNAISLARIHIHLC